MSDQYKESDSSALLAVGGRAELTLSRTSQGRIILEVRTDGTGLIDFELTEPDFACLMFGQAAVPAYITRHLPKRRPAMTANDKVSGPPPVSPESKQSANGGFAAPTC